jgi:DNA-binding MarR family transcriptional regulator
MNTDIGMIRVLRRMGEKEIGSTIAERIALYLIAASAEPLRIGQVADQIGMSRGAMTTMVDRLVEAGLVKRVASDQDRRVTNIQATARGRKAIA